MLVPGYSRFLVFLLSIIVTKTHCQQSSTTTDTPATTQATPTPTKDNDKLDTCHSHPVVEQGPPLPILDRQFSMAVECTIKEKSYTMTMTLHYDYMDNKAVLFISKDGLESRLLYNFPLYKGFYIQDDSCRTISLKDKRDGFQWINYTVIDGVGHVSDVHDLFNFGTSYNETYVPTNDTVRGMPVDQWTSCVERDGVTYRLDYYFTQPIYDTPSGHNKPIPVRAVLTSIPKTPEQSTKNPYLEHIYDFVTYKPGPCNTPDVFLIPRGSVCDCGNVKKTQPTLPDHFSMGVEVTQPPHNSVSYSKQYFDYAAKLTRTDITPSKMSRSPLGQAYGYQPLKIIHDYSTGLQYVIDVAEENCSVRAIPNNSVDARTTDPSHVHMRHGADMFSLDMKDLKYQGKRVVRDISCEVWAVMRTGWLRGVNTTMETCWAPRSEIGGLENKGEPTDMVLTQIWLRSTNKTDNYSSDYISNMFNYGDGKPDLQLFDIADCFDEDTGKLDIIFRIPGDMKTVVRHQPRHLQVAVRDAVSKAAHVSPIRVNSLFFEETSPDFIDIWMTIYDAPSVRGDVDKPVPQVSLHTAYKNLQAAINSQSGLVVQLVSDAGSKSLKVKKGSLKTDKDIDDPRLPFAYCDNNRCGYGGGHSSGSMAALGIMMLIVGAVLGLLAAFFLWKRGTGIPYQVQN